MLIRRLIQGFNLLINSNSDPQNIQKILNRLKNADNVPFSELLLMIWTCISEPDSVEAQRYLSDKAISDVVKELCAGFKTDESF